MRELTVSKHLRLKVYCLVLMIFTFYHGTGLVWLTGMFSDTVIINNEKIGDFGIGMVVSSVCQALAIFLWWWLTFRILVHYHYKSDDQSWIDTNVNIARIAMIFWGIGLLVFVIAILYANYFWWWFFTVTVAFIPLMNKWLPIGLTFTILYEMKGMKRNVRIKHWMKIITTYTAIYLSYSLITTLMYWFYTLAIWPIFVAFLCLFCVSVRYSGCCCGPCFCHCKCCGCGGWYCQTRSMLTGMTLLGICINCVLNYNGCLNIANLIEFVGGFKGGYLIIVLYVILALVDINYGKKVGSDKIRNTKIELGQMSGVSASQEDVTTAPGIELNAGIDAPTQIPDEAATVSVQMTDGSAAETGAERIDVR